MNNLSVLFPMFQNWKKKFRIFLNEMNYILGDLKVTNLSVRFKDQFIFFPFFSVWTTASI